MIRLFLLLTFISSAFGSSACSVAMLKSSSTIIAHNLDWPYVQGMAMIHPRNETHHAVLDNQDLKPLSWQSRFGNVIFHGSSTIRDTAPSGEGMNEKGLFAAILVMKHSVYPSPSESTKVLDTTHWVQYVLDNFQSVDDIIHAQSALNMVANTYKSIPMKLHLYAADKSGHQAVIEYIDGKLIIHDGNNMSQPILTNDPYDASINYLSDYQGFGGNKPLPGGYSSEARFVRVASFLKRLSKERVNAHPIALGFALMNDSAQAPYTPIQTVVSDVYDLSRLHVYYKSIFNQAIREIPLQKIDFNTLDHPIQIKVHENLHAVSFS